MHVVASNQSINQCAGGMSTDQSAGSSGDRGLASVSEAGVLFFFISGVQGTGSFQED
jgi:hypothetical protein